MTEPDTAENEHVAKKRNSARDGTVPQRGALLPALKTSAPRIASSDVSVPYEAAEYSDGDPDKGRNGYFSDTSETRLRIVQTFPGSLSSVYLAGNMNYNVWMNVALLAQSLRGFESQ
jgi:hypothetical protein